MKKPVPFGFRTTHRLLLVERQQAKAAALMKTSPFVLHGGAVMKEMRLP